MLESAEGLSAKCTLNVRSTCSAVKMTRVTDNVIICDLIVGSDAAGPDKKATLSGLISKY